MTSTLVTDVNKTIENGVPAEPAPFVWYELHTPDAAASARFYAPVLGWNIQDSGMGDRKYSLLSVDKTPLGGLLEKHATGFTAGESGRWMGYIGVNDVERYSKLVRQSGGVVHRAAEEIPGVGTFAVVADPQGAIFTLFQSPAGVTRPEQPAPGTPGTPAWHELVTSDLESASRFYTGLFGWTRDHAMDMGPNGIYQIFAIGSQPAGGIMAPPKPAHGYGWLFYFNVQDIDAVIERVKQNGGVVLHGPSEVPGGQQTAHCADTQGAFFGVVGPARK
jgi:predicted enzyme related to lactoylglutathione lyase